MTTLLFATPQIAFAPARLARAARPVGPRVTDTRVEEGKLGLHDLLVSIGQVGAALGVCLIVHGLA